MQFDDTTLHTLATKAILDSMTQEHRDALLQRAVAGLFEREKTGGYPEDKRTKFEAAFDRALHQQLDLLLRDLLKTDVYQEALRGLLVVSVEKAFSDGPSRDLLADIIGSALNEGFRKLRGY